MCIIIPGQPRAEINFCGSYYICVFNFISGKSFSALLFLFEMPPLVRSTQRLLPLDFEISNLIPCLVNCSNNAHCVASLV